MNNIHNKWLNDWSTEIYSGPQLSEQYNIPIYLNLTPAQLAIHLFCEFPNKLKDSLSHIPDEYLNNKRNQEFPAFILARCIQGWYKTCTPAPEDWINLKTVLGWLQKKHGPEWRSMFDGERPSLLNWIQESGKATGQEIDEQTAQQVISDNKKSHYKAPRFWSVAQKIAISAWLKSPPTSIQTQLDFIKNVIQMTVSLHRPENEQIVEQMINLDNYPEQWLNQEPLSIPVAIRDYSTGWDTEVRTTCQKAATAHADSLWPDGAPENSKDRVLHLKKIEDTYDALERLFEPWRWIDLNNASVEEKASVWAWITTWAPTYHWDTAIKNMDLHPPVEAIGLDYTGKDAYWWVTTPYDEKLEQAKSWINRMEMDKTDSLKNSSMDSFLDNLFQ